jgi:hypothetical protein
MRKFDLTNAVKVDVFYPYLPDRINPTCIGIDLFRKETSCLRVKPTCKNPFPPEEVTPCRKKFIQPSILSCKFFLQIRSLTKNQYLELARSNRSRKEPVNNR